MPSPSQAALPLRPRSRCCKSRVSVPVHVQVHRDGCGYRKMCFSLVQASTGYYLGLTCSVPVPVPARCSRSVPRSRSRRFRHCLRSSDVSFDGHQHLTEVPHEVQRRSSRYKVSCASFVRSSGPSSVASMASCYPLSVSRPSLAHCCRPSPHCAPSACASSSPLRTHRVLQIRFSILSARYSSATAGGGAGELWKSCWGRKWRGSRLACRGSLTAMAVPLVLADVDPENLQNLIIGASVLAATSASLYYGLKVNRFQPQMLYLILHCVNVR